MSRNISEHRIEQTFLNELNRISREQTQIRTLQPQGSQALRIESITGYQYLDVPSGAYTPEYVYIDLEMANPDEILIASLIRNTFIQYTNGTFLNADLDPHGLGDDFWSVWMSYDGRDDPDEIAISTTPSETIDQRIHQALANTSLPYHQARIGIKVNRITTSAKPSNFAQYLVVYQIRATIGGA